MGHSLYEAEEVAVRPAGAAHGWRAAVREGDERGERAERRGVDAECRRPRERGVSRASSRAVQPHLRGRGQRMGRRVRGWGASGWGEGAAG